MTDFEKIADQLREQVTREHVRRARIYAVAVLILSAILSYLLPTVILWAISPLTFGQALGGWWLATVLVGWLNRGRVAL